MLLFTSTDPNEEIAHQLYRKMGFTNTEIKNSSKSDLNDVFFMGKDI